VEFMYSIGVGTLVLQPKALANRRAKLRSSIPPKRPGGVRHLGDNPDAREPQLRGDPLARPLTHFIPAG
jgi:hypothetical protein